MINYIFPIVYLINSIMHYPCGNVLDNETEKHKRMQFFVFLHDKG
jgi:hypothetical protein